MSTQIKMPKAKPHSVSPIWVPTEFSVFENGKRKECDLVNLCGCENSIASSKVLPALTATMSDPEVFLAHWESQDRQLREKLAALHGVSPEQILLTSGAMAAIAYAFEIFVQRGSRVGLLKPEWPGFLHFAERRQANVVYFEQLEFPFAIGMRDIIRFVNESAIDFIIISNPSAVTGRLYSPSEIDSLASSTDMIVINDEADAMLSESTGYLTNKHSNLVVLRSFSKFYGLSGLRIGYVICPKELAPHFANMIHSTELTSLAIVAAHAVLDDIEYFKQTEDIVRRNLAELESVLPRTPYKLAPESKCFAAYLWGGENVEDPYRLLLRKGIKILGGEVFGLNRGGRVNLTNSAGISRLIATIAD